LGVPVIGLGASAKCYYSAVGERLGCDMIVPEHADVANAIGAVVGQVSMRSEGQVTCPSPGEFIAHLPLGPARFAAVDQAVAALTQALSQQATQLAQRAGVETPHIAVEREDVAAEIEGQRMIIEVRLRASATGRPRIANA